MAFAAIATFACAMAPARAEEIAVPEAIAQLWSAADAQQRPVVAGLDGYLFFAPELRFLAQGRFWGDRAAQVSRAAKPEWADPLPAIVDFHEQLKAHGITLLVVPVPAKATVAADKLFASAPPHDQSAGAAADTAERPAPRNDPALVAFLAELDRRGVAVLDLVPPLCELGAGAYARTDTHWSPGGVERAADAIAARVKERALLEIPERPAAPEAPAAAGAATEHAIRGDLAALGGLSAGETSETIQVRVVADPAACLDRASPVVLLGDSHVLVYSAGGDLHAEHAGLAEHLSVRLGVAIDRIGVRGSGASAARIDLLRRRDEMAGKRLVVWVFAARDLTEATDGWRIVPVLERP